MALTLLACSDEGTVDPPEPPAPILVVDGRVERGSTVVIRFVVDGDTLVPAQDALNLSPADAAELLGEGRVRLLRAGALQVVGVADGVEGRTTLDVAVPPMIVFDRTGGGERDLFRVALDGGDLERLTDHPAEDLHPSAVDGTVVFISYRDGNGEVYAAPLEGGETRRLTQTPTTELDPALSPDGSRLAFTRIVAGLSRLFVAEADGSGAVRVTSSVDHPGAVEASPAWSPDSRSLVFMSTHLGSADLWTWTDGSAPEPLVVHPDADVEPAWSPDGDHVAFVSTRDGGTDLYLVEVATDEVTRLTSRDETDAQPGWLPDGRLVYSAHVGGAVELRWLDPDMPGDPVTIPTGAGRPAHASGVFP